MSQPKWIESDAVHEHLISELGGVVPRAAWGEMAYFYNPGSRFSRGTYFATIKDRNGENDRASDLDRTEVWRLNIGVSKKTYQSLFGPPPPRPDKGGIIDGPWDFIERDVLMPHPIYGWMSWIAVLSPSEKTWMQCIPLLADAHGRAQETFTKRLRHRNAARSGAIDTA
ncbi:DUF6194 family protein [Aurantimonas sp. C2-6-R+9]|uniref:DUF6194 family protein n=1 Tax=unclassified Aurantimonas TaxID=2638230 RepID=UPI002E19798F|nr:MULTISPECIES: DUF6194 family protein [unclassified Aurantimonas]MEC5291093.1 DUF6194 family protein [Aurantimonas sp. C2-3-R2]MEC5324894.1 DUF6194 family protein [Aurantimonas sp. A3-2-R12]MEC5381421.1 DUF6194 family protein [Aurantimonas sp. C2-6-R+9]MEC5412244.1 DUF6194 family protein [Aurantimonas sp. C2-4-R8]